MLVEDNDSFRHLIRSLYPEIPESADIGQITEVLYKDGERVSTLKNFRQSQARKDSWRRKRFNYMTGINRFHRNNKVKDISAKIKDKLKSWGKPEYSSSEESDRDVLESISVNTSKYFDLYEFLMDISILESYLYESAGTFSLDDVFVESSILSDVIVEDIAVLKNCLVSNKSIPVDVFESLMIILYNETNEDCLSLTESFFAQKEKETVKKQRNKK